MEKVQLENVRPGMVLGRSIYLADGRILIREETELSAFAINKLRDLRMPAVYIKHSKEEEGVPEPVSDQTRSDLMQCLSKLDSGLRYNKPVAFSSCRRPLDVLIDEIIGNRKVTLKITEIRALNDSIYSHMVQVCIIAVKLGLEMGYNQLRMAELALGVLLHDIGMVRIPPDILNRLGGLSDEEVRQIQTHPKIGYDILKQSPDVPAVSSSVAFQHHERFNGTGYPRKIGGPDIHEYARIAAVADVFDAMTTEKIYRRAKPIPEALKHIQSLKGTEFDPVVVEALEAVVMG